MSEWSSREARQADARAEYERIMTTPSPDPMNAYIEAGVIGFVFGEMWRRGVLTQRDRRLITLTCVGSMDAAIPVETHVWAALNSGDLTNEEYDEFVLFLGTQMGWPKASVMTSQGMMAMIKLAEERGDELRPLAFETWAGPDADDVRAARGDAAYRDIHGAEPPTAVTAFRRRGYLDYLYGEIWTRSRYLTRRDHRVIAVTAAAIAGVDVELREHLRAALAMQDLRYEELQELVLHVGVYCGWLVARRLDDTLVEVADGLGVS
jgi:4-carboxymuconolactone decarboxylase